LGLYLSMNALIPLILLLTVSPFVLTTSRYIFATMPIWTTLGAVAVFGIFDSIRKHHIVLASAVFLIVIFDAMSQDYLYYYHQNGNRENWKGAYAFVQNRMKEGDIVVTTRPIIGRYYLEGTTVSGPDNKPEDIIGLDQRVWFVMDNRSGSLSPAFEDWINSNTRMEGVFDVYLPGKIYSMRVYLYEP
jgi:hypothetical protein